MKGLRLGKIIDISYPPENFIFHSESSNAIQQEERFSVGVRIILLRPAAKVPGVVINRVLPM